jgi:hypothetical protein
MKKIWTLLTLQVFTFLGVYAQQEKPARPTEITKKILQVYQNPKTAERAAHADVLLVHSRRWTAGHPNIPANYSLGPNPVIKPKE